MVIAGGDGAIARLGGAHVALAVGVVTPPCQRAITSQRKAVERPAGNGNHIGQINWRTRLAPIVAAPCRHCAVLSQGQAMTAPGGNRQDAGRP